MIRLFRHYVPFSLLLLGVAEAVVLLLSVSFGGLLASRAREGAVPAYFANEVTETVVFAVVLFLAMIAMGLYQRRMNDDVRDLLLRVVLSFVLGGLALFFILYGLPSFFPGTEAVITAIGAAFVGVILLRMLFFKVADRDLLRRRVLVLGTGEMAQMIENLRRRADRHGFVIAGYVHMPGEPVAITQGRVIQDKTPLVRLVEQLCIDELVVAIKDRRKNLPVDQLLDCKMSGVDVVDLQTFFERQIGKIRLDTLQPSWLIFSDGFRRTASRRYLKRLVDVLASVALLLVTWPVMVATAVAIWLGSNCRGPILYRQIRTGENGRPFGVLKFRSMRVDAEQNGVAQWARKDDDRVTRVGRFIRKTRIDELPQLFNVLRGDMSFVGPRPERPQFVEQLVQVIPYYNERHRVKPGITGWAQICYPYGSSEDDSREKLQYDLYYVKNYSLFLDLTILFQTAEVILWGKGAR